MKQIDKITLERHIQDWTEQNAPMGRLLGYPECCIKAFCDMPPILLQNSKPTEDDRTRFKAACINGVFTGFIPCIEHARKIVSGQITRRYPFASGSIGIAN